MGEIGYIAGSCIEYAVDVYGFRGVASASSLSTGWPVSYSNDAGGTAVANVPGNAEGIRFKGEKRTITV